MNFRSRRTLRLVRRVLGCLNAFFFIIVVVNFYFSALTSYNSKLDDITASHDRYENGSSGEVSDMWSANDTMVESCYVGNTASKKFHRPDCKQSPVDKRRKLFATRDAALADSYLPCGTCNP